MLKWILGIVVLIVLAISALWWSGWFAGSTQTSSAQQTSTPNSAIAPSVTQQAAATSPTETGSVSPVVTIHPTTGDSFTAPPPPRHK